MGRVNIELEVANYGDLNAVQRGNLEAKDVRRVKIAGVVDTGSVHLVLPESVVNQLDLPVNSKVQVKYADGHRSTRSFVEGAYVTVLGRSSSFNAIVEPKRETALVGAIVLETLDLLVDCPKQCLVPRDPRYMISEVE